MKKTMNRIIPVAIAAVLLCAMTTVAFAKSQEGPISFIYDNTRYNLNYVEMLELTSTGAFASLEISGKNVELLINATAVVNGTVWGDSAEEGLIKIGFFHGNGTTYAKATCPPANIQVGTYKTMYAECDYTYYTQKLPSMTVPLS